MPELPNPGPYQPPQNQQPNQNPQVPGQSPAQFSQQPNQQPVQKIPQQIPQQSPPNLPPGAYQSKNHSWLKWLSVIILIIIVLGIGVVIWLSKPDSMCLNFSGYTSSIRYFFKKPTFKELSSKSENLKNFQLDASTNSSTPGSIDMTILMKDSKLKITKKFNIQLPKNFPSLETDMVFYVDREKNKTYLYSPKYNYYTEYNLDLDTTSDILLSNLIGEKVNNETVSAESKEIIDGKMAYKFKVETGQSGSFTNWDLWLWSCNGLPLKAQSFAAPFNYKYSRFNEIKDSDVTLPKNAKQGESEFSNPLPQNQNKSQDNNQI